MLEINADDFVRAVRLLQHTSTFVQAKGDTLNKEESLKKGTIAIMQEGVDSLRPALVSLGAKITLMALNDFEKDLKGKPTWKSIEESNEDVKRTLHRELTQSKLLSLNDQEQLWFAPPAPPFGEKFEQGFRSQGNFELSEACKCMALERSTAAVFHLMRVMEVCLRALSRSLDISDPTKPYEKTWGKILEAVWKGIEAKWPHGAARMQGDGKLFEHLHATLDAIKTPLRDATMHVESTYTEPEAKHIFELVRGFVVKLADRMDEDGEPKAP